MAKIRDLMVKKVTTLQAHASVYEAVKLMNKNKIGSLVIVRNGENRWNIDGKRPA
jgi:predicted transcriptional regulator